MINAGRGHGRHVVSGIDGTSLTSLTAMKVAAEDSAYRIYTRDDQLCFLQ